MAATDDLTMTVTTPDGKTTGPVPVSALESAASQLTLFEGQRYPDVEIKLAGGVKGMAEMVLPEISGLRIGERFTVLVHGVVVSKKHAIKIDTDDGEVRTLVVTLKADDMHLEDEPA